MWAARPALGERDASVLDLHLRHGLGAPEIAAELGVTANNAHQLLHRLKGKLGGAIRAWVLWRTAARRAPASTGPWPTPGVTPFGADAVRVVDRHARGCAACDERRQLRLAPEALFAVVPIAVAPPLVKAEGSGRARRRRGAHGRLDRGGRQRRGGRRRHGRLGRRRLGRRRFC